MICAGCGVFALWLMIIEIVVSVGLGIWCIFNYLDRKIDIKNGNIDHALIVWNRLRTPGLVLFSGK